MIPPKDKKGLQRLLGIWNFFKNFCPQYSKATFNMRQLLKKDTKFVWTAQCQTEFDDIIHKLTNPPILQPLQVDRDFCVYSDASYAGTAFAVFQPSDDIDLSISCML